MTSKDNRGWIKRIPRYKVLPTVPSDGSEGGNDIRVCVFVCVWWRSEEACTCRDRWMRSGKRED